MIGVLHGYLLGDSGSNLWTRNVVRALHERKVPVALFCQEPHPERFSFVGRVIRHSPDGSERVTHEGAGSVTVHRPDIGETLPVFVRAPYEGFRNVIPLIELSRSQIEIYVERNVAAVAKVVRREKISLLIANHLIMMPTIAQRVSAITGCPYAIVPHGSALEYSVRNDERLAEYALSALRGSRLVFVLSDDMAARLKAQFPGLSDLKGKLRPLSVGVETAAFRVRPVTECLKHLGSPEMSATLPGGALEALRAIPLESESVLFFAGRLIAAKGLLSLFAALPMALRAHPKTHLILAGEGPLRAPLEAFVSACASPSPSATDPTGVLAPLDRAAADPEAAAYLGDLPAFLSGITRDRQKATSYGEAAKNLPGRVHFLGSLPHSTLPFIFPCADVAVFPSVVPETGPMVLLEAMACGTLPIGTDRAGIGAKLKRLDGVLPEAIAALTRAQPDRLTAELAEKIPALLAIENTYADRIRSVATESFDWSSVVDSLMQNLP